MTYYRIGRIVNTHGIKGQVKVIADTDFPLERFTSGQHLYILNQEGQSIKEIVIEHAQVHKGTYLLQFKDMPHINMVEGFKGNWLAIDQTMQQELPADEFYHHQIIGLAVFTDKGRKLGQVKEILQLGSNDVWVVQREGKGLKDALIPFIEDVVKHVDIANGQVIIELMEGLIDDED